MKIAVLCAAAFIVAALPARADVDMTALYEAAKKEEAAAPAPKVEEKKEEAPKAEEPKAEEKKEEAKEEEK